MEETMEVKIEDEVLNDFTVNEYFIPYPSLTLSYLSGASESESNAKCEIEEFSDVKPTCCEETIASSKGSHYFSSNQKTQQNSCLQEIKPEPLSDEPCLTAVSESHEVGGFGIFGQFTSCSGEQHRKRRQMTDDCTDQVEGWLLHVDQELAVFNVTINVFAYIQIGYLWTFSYL